MIPAENAGRASGQGEPSGIPAPPGTAIPRLQALHLFGELPAAMGMKKLGVFSTWAIRRGDVNWTVVTEPMTVNTRLFETTDKQIRKAVQQITFGHPLPYIVIMTTHPIPTAQIELALDGTAYKFFETQACYAQDDRTGEPPELVYLHWAIVTDDKPVKRLDAAARALRGVLCYGLQVPRKGTVSRPHPTSSFEAAYRSDLIRLPLSGTKPGYTPGQKPRRPTRMRASGPPSLHGKFLGYGEESRDIAPAPPPIPGSDPCSRQPTFMTKYVWGCDGKPKLGAFALGLGAAAVGYKVWRNR